MYDCTCLGSRPPISSLGALIKPSQAKSSQSAPVPLLYSRAYERLGATSRKRVVYSLSLSLYRSLAFFLFCTLLDRAKAAGAGAAAVVAWRGDGATLAHLLSVCFEGTPVILEPQFFFFFFYPFYYFLSCDFSNVDRGGSCNNEAFK